MSAAHSQAAIELRGVRVHNLQNVDLDVPLNKLVVITGVSGAGKSSLAFDTLYAEGQRRYIESFSTDARHFLDRLERPDADRIEPIPPAIALRAKPAAASRRATVATATEIHDYLRLLFAKAGTIVCPDCHREVRRESPASVQTALEKLPPGTRYQVCFPVAPVTPPLSKGGLGGSRNLTNDPSFTPDVATHEQHLREAGFTRFIDIDNIRLAVVDRLIAGKTTAERLTDSLETAFEHGDGQCIIVEGAAIAIAPPNGDAENIVSQDAPSGRNPTYTRFNTRLMCGGCGSEFAEPEPRLFSHFSPLGACPTCLGRGEIRVPANGKRDREWRVCLACAGARLQQLALAVQIDGKNIAELCRLTVKELATSPPLLRRGEDNLLAQIEARLQLLTELGLDYLALDRPLNTLSAGESQRVLLTATLGARLVNTLYVLDEPTIGLHPRDTSRLMNVLHRLRDAGNSVLAVEHDRALILHADQVIDIGPGAGRDGGRIVYQGSSTGIADCEDSVTGRYLSGRAKVTPQKVEQNESRGWIKLSGAMRNNLRNVTVSFPVGVLCVVSGVSGSGKSSLVQETLYPALREALDKKDAAKPQVLSGVEHIDDVILVDQTPLGRTPRSNPATCLQVYGEIRALFAETSEAKVRNYTAGHFSFNSASGGRCPTCEGNGTLQIDMQFLPDVTMTCPDCKGTRFRREILDVKYRGRTIAEVLAMTIREAFPFFRGRSRLQRRLKYLKDVGLDYLTLGQPAATLSGGESQRLKLAAALARGSRSRTLFLFDEPTAGLHPADVAKLLECLRALLAGGHSLIVIEHNLDVLRTADYIIDLGPGAGPDGGRIVAQGTPDDIAQSPDSITGRFLETQ